LRRQLGNKMKSSRALPQMELDLVLEHTPTKGEQSQGDRKADCR
jgi:hypothetical protein